MKKVVVGVVLLIVVVLGFSLFNKNEVQPEVEADLETPIVSDVEVKSETVELAVENNTASGIYTMYNGDLSKYENKDIVLFLKADWCPSCRVLDGDIKASLGDIPENVVLLELNYDKETELKKKYGVTTQHTMVQVDVNGDLIKKWSGGSRLEDVLSQIN
jgi:thiol-disulfide isomerase/thioredoxin